MSFYLNRNLAAAGKSKMVSCTSLANSVGQVLEEVESALFNQFQQLFSLRILGHKVYLFRISLIPLSIVTKPWSARSMTSYSCQ